LSDGPVLGRAPHPLVVDGVVLVGLLAVAAFLRLPGLEVRGEFAADQGHIQDTLQLRHPAHLGLPFRGLVEVQAR